MQCCIRDDSLYAADIHLVCAWCTVGDMSTDHQFANSLEVLCATNCGMVLARKTMVFAYYLLDTVLYFSDVGLKSFSAAGSLTPLVGQLLTTSSTFSPRTRR